MSDRFHYNYVNVSQNKAYKRAEKERKAQFDLSGKLVNPPRLDLSKYRRPQKNDQ